MRCTTQAATDLCQLLFQGRCKVITECHSHLEVEGIGRPSLSCSTQQHPSVAQAQVVQHMCSSSLVVACSESVREEAWTESTSTPAGARHASMQGRRIRTDPDHQDLRQQHDSAGAVP